MFGDLPTRFARWGVQRVPWFLEPVVAAGWAFLLFLLAKKQRRAVAANLRAIWPQWSSLKTRAGVLRVFWNFACVQVDSLRCTTGSGDVDWLLEGAESFAELTSRKDGCLVLTAHMGTYDTASALFAEKFGRTLYAVRAPERSPELQAFREREIREKEEKYPLFRTLYNQPGNLLGVELARCLREGHVVAVQADRVMFEVSEMEVEVEPGLIMKLPRGPLALARATNAPCYPLFVTRRDWRLYTVTVGAALDLPPRKRGQEDPAAQIWGCELLGMIRSAWWQWFVFEELFERRTKGSAS